MTATNNFGTVKILMLKGEKGDKFEFEDYTPEELESLRGEKGDPFTYDDFTEEQLTDLRSSVASAYYRKIDATYHTVGDNTETIPIPIEGYTSADMLFVDVEGLALTEGVDYTIEGSDIILTEPITHNWTAVNFRAIRSFAITTEDYDSLIDGLTDDVGTYVDEWLTEHPEATTTVEDGTITDAKLVQSGGILSKLEYLQNEELQSVFGSFDITAGVAHSSNNDRLSFPCKSGETICIQVVSANGEVYTSIPIYGSSESIASHTLKSTKTDGKWYEVTLTEDLNSFGLYLGAKTADDTITWRIRKKTSVFFDTVNRTIFTCAPNCYFEPIGTNGGMWVKLSTQVYLRGKITDTKAWSAFMPDSHAVSPAGVTECIYIPHNNILVYDINSKEYSIIAQDNLNYETHLPLLWVGTRGTTEAIVGGIGYHLYAAFIANAKTNVSTTEKAIEYAAIVNDAVETEQFLYFTDPHLMGSNNDASGFLNNLETYLDAINAYVNTTSITFTMCGGDWLNNKDNPSIAKHKLGLVYGACKKFGEFYGVVGNHDTNYQGVDAEGNTNSGTLDNQAIANAMFGNEHQNYYSFDGTNTRFYVFDSGTDWASAMTDYRWEQIAWFANALLEDDKPHSAVSIHIWYTNYNDQTADTISPLASNITSIVEAYNSRSTISLNDIVYDFSDCQGRIEFVICGHTHFDKSGTCAGIPVINTLNTTNGNTPSFDLVYVDYDNRIIQTVRVGTGDNRTFNLSDITQG